MLGVGDPFLIPNAFKIRSDVGGVLSINEKLEESPELVNESPYGSGWMVQMEPSGEMPALIDAESYKNSLD